jgi:DNA-binding transcriptional MerR regulator/effector-binding domain-containing protein
MKISDLAHLARVSTRTLRHYDEIGLFKPTRIDSLTGYREYSVNQIALLNRILALRDLGFSLEQISTLTANGFAPERLRDLLELRKAELETHILEQSKRLEQVEFRLERINRENNMFDYSVNLKALPNCLVASVGNKDLDLVEENVRSLKNYYSVLFDHLEQNGVQKSLPQINIAHPTKDDFWKMEVAQMLEKPIPESDLVKVYELNGVPMAAFLEFRGVHEWRKLEDALVGLLSWVEEHGYNTVGAVRQVYLEMPEGYGEGVPCVIELQVPVKLSGNQTT